MRPRSRQTVGSRLLVWSTGEGQAQVRRINKLHTQVPKQLRSAATGPGGDEMTGLWGGGAAGAVGYWINAGYFLTVESWA